MKFTRTRQHTDVVLAPLKFSGMYRTGTKTGTYFTPWPGNATLPLPRGTIEREIADVQSKQSHGTHPVNPCLDTNVRLISRAPEIFQCLPPTRTDQLYSFEGFIRFHPELIRGYSHSRANFDSGQLAYQAFDTFSTQVPEEISIANFALEWRDSVEMLPGLVEHFANAWKTLPAAIKRNGSVSDIMSAGGKSSASKELSSAHLGFQFGVLPLIGDLQKIAGLLGRVQARLDHLRSVNGKSKRLQYLPGGLGTPADFSNGVPVIRPRVLVPTSTALIEDTLVLDKAYAHFVATAYIDIELEGLDGIEGYLRTLYGSLGLNNPLGVIWNALPLSFLLDWVFDFSGFLARHAVRPFNGTYRVRDLTHSYKSSSTWIVERRWFDQYTLSYKTAPIGEMVETTYDREVGLPTSELGSLLNFPLSPGQAALSLALARQFSK